MNIWNYVLINGFNGGFSGTDGMPIQSICCTNWRRAPLRLPLTCFLYII
jgi:hypothetical protein